MNTGMCQPTISLSGSKAEDRNQGRDEAKSYPQLVLGHKSVTFEKKADVVLHVSKVNLLPFTAAKSSLLIPSNLLLVPLFSSWYWRNNEPSFFFLPPKSYVTSINVKGLVTHAAKQDIQNWPLGSQALWLYCPSCSYCFDRFPQPASP